MNKLEAMFRVIKRDDWVADSDAYYCQDGDSLGVFHDYLTKKNYQPYILWVAEKDGEEQSSQKTSPIAPTSVHSIAIDATLFNSIPIEERELILSTQGLL